MAISMVVVVMVVAFPRHLHFLRLNGQLTLIPATTAFRSVPFRTVSATTAVTLHH